IRDKITANSDAASFSYDYSIEKEKPMKWLVKNPSGTTVQEVMLSDNGKYYIYFYEGDALTKRLLFSKHHTLLKGEYFDTATGVVRCTLEPRKAQGGLCILYTVKTNPQPQPLFEEPEIADERIADRIAEEFTDYTAVASTDRGVVRFLSDDQLASFNAFIEKCEQDLANIKEETFVDSTPLLDKIKAKDFNVKRNLSSSLDITRAMAFSMQEDSEVVEPGVIVEHEPYEPVEAVVEEAPSKVTEVEPVASSEPAEAAIDASESIEEAETVVAEPETIAPETAEIEIAESETVEPETVETKTVETETVETETTEPEAHEPEADDSEAHEPEIVESEPEESEPTEKTENEPDKRIMADGAIYSYYGDLDDNGNRSGYGRTLTELGRTAYEGHYFNDKRSGNGSYFYKNGSLCYTGDWLENARHGVGVGVSSHDGSIHVGNWRNNKPDGTGVRLTAEGDIKFVCKELSDGSTVLMHYMPDDTIIVSKYDESGRKIGNNTISLSDIVE
ncbi:MAG: hypothetical protein IJT56_11620, partial [Clostridia bacterium]|nr:hypothetical protein [Clostridia bacterium]